MNQFLRLKNLKTLLIDDNVIIRDTMQMIFAQIKCSLKSCETAEEGLQALEKERFDIIISDLQLPGIDGVEFFRQAVRAYPDTVKILISGYGDQCTISEAFEIGVHAFIKKPFALTTFLEQLMPHVEKQHDRISQFHDTAETESEPDNPEQTRAGRNKCKDAWQVKAKHARKPLSYLPPESKKKGTISGSRYCPTQVTV